MSKDGEMLGRSPPMSLRLGEERQSLSEIRAENASVVLCDRSFLTSSFRKILEHADLDALMRNRNMAATRCAHIFYTGYVPSVNHNMIDLVEC